MDVIISLLMDAVKYKASDIHISVDEVPSLRIDGQLLKLGDEPVREEDMLLFIQQVLDDLQQSFFASNGSVDFAYTLYNEAQFRMNAYRQNGRLALAARRIPVGVPTIEELGLPEILNQLTTQHDGLILVTGPTGSGKSTTLAAMIEAINRREARHIITLEDPIEYVYEQKYSLIHQREVGRDVLDFASGLRAALRQDPDVILVGEMRDLETIRTAITAAETGHLVLSTLHTQDAVSTIDRMIDVFPAEQQKQVRSQIASTLRAVIGQRLLPKRIGGRIAALEILINIPSVANLIRQEKTHQIYNVIQTSRQLGMQTFEQAWAAIRAQGEVDLEAVHLLPLNKEGDYQQARKQTL